MINKEIEFRADLHCHSTYSDGTCTPEQLLYKAKESNLSGLSITDHDTTKSYKKDVFDLAKKLNILLLPGVEISSALDKESVHILAYGKGIFKDNFQEFLNEVLKKRKIRNLKILEKLKSHKILISEEELYDFNYNNFKCSESTIGRPHIALLMVEKGYAESFQEAFQKYLKDNACCYVLGEKFPPQEVIEKIHSVNAKAVLAHPHLMNYSIVRRLLKLSFDGIEAYYGRMIFKEEEKWVHLAKDKNLIATGGSDFHGDFKSHLILGSSWATKDIFQQFDI